MESFRVLLYAVQEYNVLKFAEINCVAILDDREFITQDSKIVLEWNGPLENISRPQVMGNCSPIFASPNRYFTENSSWVPLKKVKVLFNTLIFIHLVASRN